MYRRVLRRTGSEVALAEMPGFRREAGPAIPSADDEAAAAPALLLEDEEAMIGKPSPCGLWDSFRFDWVLIACDGSSLDVP